MPIPTEEERLAAIKDAEEKVNVALAKFGLDSKEFHDAYTYFKSMVENGGIGPVGSPTGVKPL